MASLAGHERVEREAAGHEAAEREAAECEAAEREAAEPKPPSAAKRARRAAASR
jgi:hypothetical protein